MARSDLQMNRPAFAAALLALTLAAGPPAGAADPAHPVVVELFQSQGCSSCPPANANFIPLADRPDVLALSFQVTYWDSLGWKDTFDDPAFTARQWDYAHAWKKGQVATPQVVVNGRAETVGAAPGEIAALIAKADRGVGGPRVSLTADSVTVSGAKPARPGEVWLVGYDPRIQQVAIRRGENGGRTLPHKNVVRSLQRLGAWNGGEARFALPPQSIAGLRTAAIVQEGPGGPIIAAARG